MPTSLALLLQLLLRRRRGLTLLGSACAGLMVLITGAGATLDDALRAVRDGIRAHPASGAVHIVEIDARSLAKIDHWPWPRDLHARAVDRLREAGVRTVAFDVDFSARSTPAGDTAFAHALERFAGGVVLPTFRQLAGTGADAWMDNLPIEPLRRHAFLGAVNIRPDRDGAVRRYPLGVSTAGTARPSLAAMLSEVPARAGLDFAIDYAIDPQTIPRHSFIDLIEGRIPPAALRGSRVLIGATAIELGDRYAVPRQGVIPGVVIQALAAETLLANGVPMNAGGVAPLAFALLAILALLKRTERAVRATLFALGALFVMVVPLATEAASALSFDIAPALSALGIAAAVTTTLSVLEAFHRRRLEDIETGLPNARAMAGELSGEPNLLMAVIRIDGFAAIAAGLGPADTPTLIQRVAERVAMVASGRVYRFEEAALAWRVAPEDEPMIDDRFAVLAGLMRSPVICGGRTIDVRASFGLAEGDGDEARRLVSAALVAAGRAAELGSGWERVAEGEREESDWKLSLISELDEAMASGALWVAYQPKYDIAEKRYIGAEALVRWRHPVRGAIPPDQFIPIVEQQGRADELTAYVLETALADAARWRAAGLQLNVAVNMSATLIAKSDFVERIAAAVRRHGLPPHTLTLEITESAAIASPDAAIAALEQLRDLGIRMSVDDYGTGQSTMTYLKRLPASEVKIDKSFIKGIGENRSDLILVRSTIELAHELGLKVVAEGIEDAKCLDLLAALGCDVAQGWHTGRPMAADDFAAFVAPPVREAA